MKIQITNALKKKRGQMGKTQSGGRRTKGTEKGRHREREEDHGGNGRNAAELS
jgi:hypothetical protein